MLALPSMAVRMLRNVDLPLLPMPNIMYPFCTIYRLMKHSAMSSIHWCIRVRSVPKHEVKNRRNRGQVAAGSYLIGCRMRLTSSGL